MGYKSRTVREEFPEFSEDDDPIWVKILNPKLLPASFFDSNIDLPLPPKIDGLEHDAKVKAEAEFADATSNALIAQTIDVVSRLVVDWHVYPFNPADPEADVEPLPVPATPESVRQLPNDIFNTLAQLVTDAISPKSAGK